MERTGRRGFTLLELIIGMTMGLAIVSVAMGLTVGTLGRVRHSRDLAHLHRDGAFAARVLEADLRLAGLGVPTGQHIVSGERLIPMLVAAPTELGILGDLPRPDAQYNTFGPLHNRPTRALGRTGGLGGLAWHTENNGSCVPDGCAVSATSVFFPGPGAQLCTVNADDRGCPWGTRRVRPGDDLQVVAADKTWGTTRAAGPALSLLPPLPAPVPPDPQAQLGLVAAPVSLRLAEPIEPGRIFDATFQTSQTNAVRWRDHEPGTLPGGSVGQGFVTTLDRAFYFVADRKLMRVQCWGRPAPDDGSWPSLASANAVPAAIKSGGAGGGASGGPGATCTEREVVARDVESVVFRYFDIANFPVAGDARQTAHRVEFEITLRRAAGVAGIGAQYVVSGSVALGNGGG